MNKRFGLLPVMAVMFLLSSCASNGFSGRAALTGFVSGPDGRGIPNYRIDAGSGRKCVTGMNGMFTFPDVKNGIYDFKGSKKGWSTLEEKVCFSDRKSIVCFRSVPLKTVYAQVEELLHAGLVEEAEKKLELEKESNGEDELYEFYSLLVSNCKSKSERKIKKLITMAGEK